jgi:pyrophosphate--fructose-6-phosphate 1-phosphotransferase
MKKIAILTAGGIALCLSSAIAALIKAYVKTSSEIERVCYRNGCKELLLGDLFGVTHTVVESIEILYQFGSISIGNSRVK